MNPTLKRGEVVKVTQPVSSPKVGDIVTYHPPVSAECGPNPHLIKPGGRACALPVPEESGGTFVQRIVAGPGDVVSISKGHVTRNGKPEQGLSIKPCRKNESSCEYPKPLKIRPGHWFMMGDNRGKTIDSRSFGPVPTSWLIGLVQLPEV
jgi:signal peptidase I